MSNYFLPRVEATYINFTFAFFIINNMNVFNAFIVVAAALGVKDDNRAVREIAIELSKELLKQDKDLDKELLEPSIGFFRQMFLKEHSLACNYFFWMGKNYVQFLWD